MFFEEDDKNLDNLDDLELDLGEFEDKSITWDELLEDKDLDLVSVKKSAGAASGSNRASSVDEEIDFNDVNIMDTPPEKDAFDVFGGNAQGDFSEDDDSPVVMGSSASEIEVEQYASKSAPRGTRNVESQQIGLAGTHPKNNAAMDEYKFSMQEPAKKTNTSTILGAVLAVILVFAGGFYYFFYMQGGNISNNDFAGLINQNNQAQEQPVVNTMKEEANQAAVDAPQDPATTDAKTDATKAKADAKKSVEKKMVLDVKSAGRSNPFVPVANINLAGFMTSSPVDIMTPPEEFGDMQEVQKLMEITVSGILFDSVKPSAIINVSGSDYFVQKGDKVDNYLVTQITPTNVTISSGRNTYKAGVGQNFDSSKIDGQTMLVQNRKFAGGKTRQYTSPSEIQVNVKDQQSRDPGAASYQ